MEVEDTSKEINARLLTNDSTQRIDDLEKDKQNANDTDDTLSRFVSNTDQESANSNVYTDLATSEFCTERNCENLISSQSTQDSLDEKDTSTEKNKTDSSKQTSENLNSSHVSQAPLAFTIDFDDNKEVDTAKFQNLFERYNARHKRNLSASKVETSVKKSGNLLSPNLAQKQKLSSTHSEGYFSSEDDAKRKTDQLSEKFKQLGTKSAKFHNLKKSENAVKDNVVQNREDLMTRSYDDQTKHNKLLRQNISLELGNTTKASTKSCWKSQKSATINDLSRIQMNNFDDNTEKSYQKNIEYIEMDNKCKNEEEEEFGKSTDDIYDEINDVSDDYNFKSTSAENINQSSVSCTIDPSQDTNLDVFNVSNNDGGSDGAVSEAGTYTIHKDYTDEEKARMDIDKVFSVGVLTENESNEAYVHSFKMSISRDNSTWISEWATQVAQHNSLPPVIGSSTGRTPPLSPTKIPSPIHCRSQRIARGRYEQSDSSLDTESYMRIKERIGLIPNQNTLIDSGGESDDDTSNSYNTPPHSSQRTPVHGNSLARRSSLSESLFRRVNSNENRRSVRKYLNTNKSKTEDGCTELLKSPSHVATTFHSGRRSSSLDRKEYTSDTNESNTSRRNSVKYYPEDESKQHTNSPVLSRLRPSIPKLTNSPIVTRKTSLTKIINSPTLEKAKHLTKSSPQAKNIGYFTCVENSPYMLRKSNSTTSYHEGIITHGNKELSSRTNVIQNSPELQRNLNIQRSSSNASIRNMKLQGTVSRRNSFNNSDIDKISSRGRFNVASDSSSETGEQQNKSVLPLSTGIKFNRAFSIRRARLTCESDTTPNTTPEERRRRAQSEVKSVSVNKQQNHYRARTSSVGAHNKESSKRSEPPKTRVTSISRTDSGRFSMRAPKTSHHMPVGQRASQKPEKDHKKSGRSNSTLTSKEVEFQNWKRRKSYDPMKAAAEGRKKLIEGTKKHHSTEDSSNNHDSSVLRSASFHGTGGALSLANDWSDNELEYSDNKQIPPPCSPQLESDSDLETASYLQTTQNVVSAMSARITVYRPPLVDSDNESDDDTSHSLQQSISKATHQISDTESSDERQPVTQSALSNTKYNRAFSLRRARLDTPTVKTATSNAMKNKSVHDGRSKSESVSGIARTDPGRMSMRLSRNTNIAIKTKPKESKKSAPSSTKEVEMQNWKRRKSYDPMKAAMEGRRKAGLAKRNVNANLSPSNVARSQSFHGSVGLGNSDWSDEELVVSADETSVY